MRASPSSRDAADSDDMAIAAARLVCRAWRRLVGSRLTGTIIPASFQTADHLAAFPAVTIVDLRDVSGPAARRSSTHEDRKDLIGWADSDGCPRDRHHCSGQLPDG